MSLLEQFCRFSIRVEENDDPWYGSDQMNITYPIRFATVSIQLKDTNALIYIADHVRVEAGFAPITPVCGYSYDDCDQDAWYNFYVGINDLDGGQLDGCISFLVVNSRQFDNDNEYLIYLSKEEQKVIYLCIDEECKKKYEKSCAELLEEAKAEMMSVSCDSIGG